MLRLSQAVCRTNQIVVFLYRDMRHDSQDYGNDGKRSRQTHSWCQPITYREECHCIADEPQNFENCCQTAKFHLPTTVLVTHYGKYGNKFRKHDNDKKCCRQETRYLPCTTDYDKTVHYRRFAHTGRLKGSEGHTTTKHQQYHCQCKVYGLNPLYHYASSVSADASR